VPDGGKRPPARIARAALWSLPWSVGVGVGVALGGWLTVAGGSGSPGVLELNLGHDLLVVPLICSAVVFFVLFGARVLAGVLTARFSAGS
jgi:hypothetical protein